MKNPDKAVKSTNETARLSLDDGARIAVIGGGPAGSLFSYFTLQLAKYVDLKLELDIYEPRDFSMIGPPGCNMCGGVISETLVQNLLTEGIKLPPTVVERGIDSYQLHTNVGSVQIASPDFERRIATVYRGSGPRDNQGEYIFSFDKYLLDGAVEKGARLIHRRVDEVKWVDGRPNVTIRHGGSQDYDLLVISAGINTALLKNLEETTPGFKAPKSTKTFICEYYFGREIIEKYLGNSFHAFLLDIPKLEFAAIIPKGDYVTVCLLGQEIDANLIDLFFQAPEVKQMMPPGWERERVSCQCSPRMNIGMAEQPFSDRMVVIGDSGVSRLYKDGMGAAYRMAKAAASTVVFQGISKTDFERHFWPACKKMSNDNQFGMFIFSVVHIIQKLALSQRAVLNMVASEQNSTQRQKTMSTVLWDMFTGSAPYQDIFYRTLNIMFLLRFLGFLATATIKKMSDVKK